MPSSSRRCSEPPLSREQCLLAGKVLKARFDPSCVHTNVAVAPHECPLSPFIPSRSDARRLGLEQLTKARKGQLVDTVNRDFQKQGLPGSYTLNKLETWTGNSLYRYRCIQKQHRPQSWRPKGEVLAGKAAVAPSLAQRAGVKRPLEMPTITYRSIRPRASPPPPEAYTLTAADADVPTRLTSTQTATDVDAAGLLCTLSALCGVLQSETPPTEETKPAHEPPPSMPQTQSVDGGGSNVTWDGHSVRTITSIPHPNTVKVEEAATTPPSFESSSLEEVDTGGL